MSNSKPFHFKQFSVHHDRCAMKVGTDGVLLGAWASIENTKHILDIGTGSGVIALMLAQRTNEAVLIDAIEIEKADAEQAGENVLNSPWANRISVHQKSLQDFLPNNKYDLIVSNPPYFVNSLLPPTKSRTQARHTSNLSFEELIAHSLRLLNDNGRLAVILPFNEGNIFKTIAEKNQLYLIRETAFHSKEEKPQERWLLEFSFQKKELISDKLTLYNSNGNKSSDYQKLTFDFYKVTIYNLGLTEIEKAFLGVFIKNCIFL